MLWTRQLALVLGSSVQSAALIAGTFLFLLGLGARLGSRLSRRFHPLLSYALLELTAALSGALVTWILPRTAVLSSQLVASLGDSQALLTLSRCLLAFALLGLPCLAMGASLPVLCAWLAQREDRLYLRSLSRLYAVNTLGAVAGVVLADWVLIRRWGLLNSGLLAAGLDALVAVLALLVWRGAPALAPQPPAKAKGVARFSREFLLLAGLGVAGAMLQVVWTRSLIVFHGSDVRAFSTCLATYLAGLAVGGGLAGLLPTRWSANNRALSAAILIGCVASLLSFLTLKTTLHGQVTWLATLWTIGPTALCMGAAFPLASEALHRRWPDSAEVAGWTVLVNTLGSLAGAWLTGFVLLPNLGLQFCMVFACLVLAGLALLSARQLPWQVAGGLAGAAVLAVAMIYPSDYLKQVLYPDPRYRFLFWGEDSYGSVALVEEYDSYLEEQREVLLVDGFNMMGSGLQARRYATAIGALPVLLQPKPEDALVICFGLAHTVTAVLGLEDTQRVDCVELSPTVVQAVSRTTRGQKALENPKMHLKIGDGRHHLLTTSRRYNLIVAEPPPPQHAGVVNLYSREYYQLCKRCLRPGGMVVQWLPIFQLSRRDGHVITRAFLDVFPNSYLIEGAFGQLLLLGTDGPLKVNYSDFAARAQRAQALLGPAGWDSPADLLASFLAGPERLREYAGSWPALTDDWPILQYDREAEPDYAELVLKEYPEQIPVEFANAGQRAEVEKARTAHRNARIYFYRDLANRTDPDKVPWVSTLLVYRAGQLALSLEPNSQYLQELALCFDKYRDRLIRRCDGPEATPEACANLARILYFRGQWREALQRLDQSEKLKPDPFLKAFRIWILWQYGQINPALELLKKDLSALNPYDRGYLEKEMAR